MDNRTPKEMEMLQSDERALIREIEQFEQELKIARSHLEMVRSRMQLHTEINKDHPNG